jgi:hypothetical protein
VLTPLRYYAFPRVHFRACISARAFPRVHFRACISARAISARGFPALDNRFQLA